MRSIIPFRYNAVKQRYFNITVEKPSFKSLTLIRQNRFTKSWHTWSCKFLNIFIQLFPACYNSIFPFLKIKQLKILFVSRNRGRISAALFREEKYEGKKLFLFQADKPCFFNIFWPSALKTKSKNSFTAPWGAPLVYINKGRPSLYLLLRTFAFEGIIPSNVSALTWDVR